MTDKEKVLTPITDRAEIPAFHPLKPVSEMMVLAETARELESMCEELYGSLELAWNGALRQSRYENLRARYQAMKEKAK